MNTLVQKSIPGATGSQAAAPVNASWARLAWSSARAALALCILTGIAYPLATHFVAQSVWSHQAQGSLIERAGKVVGSALIGQAFTGAAYFQGRPSMTTAPDPAMPESSVAAPYNPGLSAASNQGMTNKNLAETVAQRVDAYRTLNRVPAGMHVPVDAVTASASGLDPHISVANAALQLPRVAQARGLRADQVQPLLTQATEQRTAFLLGEPRVNVLRLNLALDALQTPAKALAKTLSKE